MNCGLQEAKFFVQNLKLKWSLRDKFMAFPKVFSFETNLKQWSRSRDKNNTLIFEKTLMYKDYRRQQASRMWLFPGWGSMNKIYFSMYLFQFSFVVQVYIKLNNQSMNYKTCVLILLLGGTKFYFYSQRWRTLWVLRFVFQAPRILLF